MKLTRLSPMWSLLIVLLMAVVSLAGARASEGGDRKVQFNRDIRPILTDNCFHCHGPDPGSRKGGLRLDREDGLFTKRKEATPVVKGDPAKSAIYERIVSKDEDEVMPPPDSHKKLKPAEITAIKQWIADGAPWEPHWSFIKPTSPALPEVKDTKWSRNPIDRFLLAKMEKAGLTPAPEADRRTLARRLSLDLTGLPPEPELTEAFVNDKSPDAYEKLVDQLMAKPQYGEHRGRYWLDAARYADTHGLHFDNYRDIWSYRDWVINAFNKNQPFDQFTVEQLAGDLLPNPTKSQLVATGFHRCNITTNEGGTIEAENLAQYARDRVETTSWVWLGLTANCCVCHDHKFDPLTTKEFYSMTAYFRNTTQGGLDGNRSDTPPVMRSPMGADEARYNALPGDIAETKKKYDDRKKALRPEFDQWLSAAKPADWETRVSKIGEPELLLPLSEESKGNEAPGLTFGKPVSVKSKSPLVWNEGKSGKAPVISDKAPLEVDTSVGKLEKDKPFSYGCWVKIPAGFKGSAAIMSRMDDQDNYRGWDLWVQNDEFAAHFVNLWPTDAIKVASGNKVKRGTWQHVFLTYDGSMKASGFKMYVDGKEVTLKAESDTLKSDTRTDKAPLLLGQRKTTSPLNGGQIQDARIYNKRLTGEEVKSLAVAHSLTAILAKAPKDRKDAEKNELFEAFIAGDKELTEASAKTAALETEKKTIEGRSPVAYIMEEKKNSTPMAFVLFRGEYDKTRDKVEPGIFSALHPLPKDAPKNRLGLAQWIISPENPLTARVTVNRMWQEIFGTGIVKTAEDFGIVGEAPSHQDLLDWLAVEFRDGGWDMKKMIRLMVTSAAYRQSAVTTAQKVEKDPANRLMSHGPRYRMDAEMVRDYALAASATLSTKIGGPSVKPYQPPYIWESVGMQESNTHNYVQDKGDNLYRRSMYSFWKRFSPPASLEIMNAPSRETSCVRRERTNTPLQALVTLNDPQFIEAARNLAQNALKTAKNEAAPTLDFMARKVLCRPLSDKESALVLDSQSKLLEYYKSNPVDAKAVVAVGESKPDATFDVALLAAWTMVGNELLNLDEVLNK